MPLQLNIVSLPSQHHARWAIFVCVLCRWRVQVYLEGFMSLTAPAHVVLAVDLIELLENNRIPAATVLTALPRRLKARIISASLLTNGQLRSPPRPGWDCLEQEASESTE